MNNTADMKAGFERPAEFLALAGSWVMAASFFQAAVPAPGPVLAWVLLSAALSMLVLSFIGHFDEHAPRNQVGVLLNVLLALPISALLAWALVALVTTAPPVPPDQAAWVSAGAAFAFALTRRIIRWSRRVTDTRGDLEAYLLPEEEEALTAEIESSGMSEWIKVLPRGASGPERSTPRGSGALVISRRAAHDLKACPDLLGAHLRGRQIIDVSQLLKELRGRVRLRYTDAWSFLLSSTRQTPGIRLYFYMKALFEPLLAAVLIVLFSPLLAGVAVAVRLMNGSPVLYRQKRLGYRGREFMLLKFRTMSVSAERSGPEWAKENDARTTPLGAFLRKTHLDELPQLFNVLRRELSFVGPRPERPEFYEVLNEQIPMFSLRLLVRPGITGWAQTRQKYAASVEECKIKLEYDLYYVQNMSPRFDLRVMIDTLAILLRGNSGR